MPAAISIIVVERTGELRVAQMKEYSQSELCKKCKCKPSPDFGLHAEWAYSGPDNDRFVVELWARENGAAGQENKYEFPPPVDTILFFGACALVAKDMTPQHNVIPLTLERWDKMYNFLFGGFDTLATCEHDDEFEEDELDSLPAHRKTKDGYLKDGFVVDNDSEEDDEDEDEDDDEEEEETATETDDDDYDDDGDDDDDDNDDGDGDDDNDTDDGTPKKCKHDTKKLLATKPAASKKRNARQMKEDLVDPSFELAEEAYEYPDD